ncbi:sigma-54 dependent transcriptional regulator [Phaeobacter sp. J2-8]|uniref:sigma-54-dependent transcriptional regulator n=1 Tax=Phaeobacter sp. J2-8 TaxID=2931394 RepID=UPI001FD3CC4D|nr:sigma-54 dependent transcriptional regulator [Phaeobacter sp. J2-8]MCJ7872313.1 sigma-54 dependent transcriptional regulator [Phaeobacter sp. J2-8]
MKQVLLVDDDAGLRDALCQSLDLAGFSAVPAASFVVAKDHIRADFPGVILSDIRMPGRDGFHLLDFAQEVDAELPVILLTGEGDVPMAVRALGAGAFAFLEKPCQTEELLKVLERAISMRTMVLENRRFKNQLEAGDAAARLLFGASERSEALRAQVRQVAHSTAEALVTGPQGSGISKVAEVIHLCSPRAKGPFEKRAARIMTPDDLVTAFGMAKGGALFLDGIADMPADSQLVLLDLLDSQREVRFIAGAVGGLDTALAEGRIDSDLFYRLNVHPVRIPALSERPEDIPVMFRHYVEQAAEQAGIPVPEISHDHAAALMAQNWPGNARSLMSAAMRFVLGMPEEVARNADLGLAEQMAQVERSLLVAALGRQNGRASEAAKQLKLPRKTFYDKLTRYGIKPEDFRR